MDHPARESLELHMSHPNTRLELRLPGSIVVLAGLTALAFVPCAVAMTSHAGWPPDQHLVMDKGPVGRSNKLVGKDGVHNYLLGGYGNDTIYGGDSGDVIWGDYHPSGESRQTAVVHAGDGANFIYANDTVNYVWTGTNPRTVVHAHEDSGVIHCENPHIVVFTSHHALPHYKLDGCRHISFYSVGY
jgi:RTX calcium-binding nonapeptide repeat (4 copies)